MNCWECRDLIATAARGREMPEATAEHLARCRACREFAAQWAAAAPTLACWQGPVPEASAAGRTELVRRLAAAPRQPSAGSLRSLIACILAHRAPRTRPAARAMAAVWLLAALVLALARLERGRSPGQPEPASVQRPQPERSARAPRSAPQPPRNERAPRLAHWQPEPPPPSGGSRPSGAGSREEREDKPSSLSGPRLRLPAPAAGDLPYVNRRPEDAVRQWARLAPDEWEGIEARVRRVVRVRDDFITIPFPRVASTSDRQIAQAIESYKREAAIVDPRLVHEVTCAFKGTALSDLCEQLRSETGIQLSAGPSVADEKVTVFCEKLPLRDVMRQLSRPFGYTWLRSRKEGGEYRYELVQDLKSQLLEEELRNRDRDAALLALDREIQRYRPYLNLSPDEALARAKTAAPSEKVLLETLSGRGWGPIQMYFRLSRNDLETLRSGQLLTFSVHPLPGQQPLPSDVSRGVLQALRDWRLSKSDYDYNSTQDLNDPRAVPLTAIPGVGGQLWLWLHQSELGQFTLAGASGFFSPKRGNNLFLSDDRSLELAVGLNPAALKPDNKAADAKLLVDPALRLRITVRAQASCHLASDHDGGSAAPEPRVTSADVLEALHRSGGLPIVADYYTHLYRLGDVSPHDQPLFAALNQLGDTMRLRWTKDAGWLELRSATFYNDRLKEVPNRLLSRWAAARRQHGMLTLDDLVETAQLPDAQLDAVDMMEGAKECWGLAEWDLVHASYLRTHLRYLTGFTPLQRQEAMSAAGLPFTRMSLPQQQQFIASALRDAPLQSLDELNGATLRVAYTQPGWFQWGDPGAGGFTDWVVPLEPGSQGRRVLRPVVQERTREAALQALRRIDPQFRQALLERMRRGDPRGDRPLPAEEAEISPTKLYLAIVYIPGTTNARPLLLIDPSNDVQVGGE